MKLRRRKSRKKQRVSVFLDHPVYYRKPLKGTAERISNQMTEENSRGRRRRDVMYML